MTDWEFIPDDVKDMLTYICKSLDLPRKRVLSDLIRDYYYNLKDLEDGVKYLAEDGSICSGNWKGAKHEDK